MREKLWFRKFPDCLKPSGAISQAALDAIKDHDIVRVNVLRRRSRKHHGLFFACIDDVYANWPESHHFKPGSSKHLRAWLLVEAGYHEILSERIEGDIMSAMLMGDFVARVLERTVGQGKFGFVKIAKPWILVYTPRSIDWATLDQRGFSEVSQRVSDVLKAEIGMSLDDFKQNLGQAA